MSWWAILAFVLAVWGCICLAIVAGVFALGTYFRRMDRRARERWPHGRSVR